MRSFFTNWRGSGAEVVESRRCSHAEIAERLPKENKAGGKIVVLI